MACPSHARYSAEPLPQNPFSDSFCRKLSFREDISRNCPKSPDRARIKVLRADETSEEALFRRLTGAKSAVQALLRSLFGRFRSGNPVFEKSIERQPVSRHIPRRVATFAEPRSFLARPAPACGCPGVTSGVASVFQGEVGGTCSSCTFQMRNAPLSSASPPRWARIRRLICTSPDMALSAVSA